MLAAGRLMAATLMAATQFTFGAGYPCCAVTCVFLPVTNNAVPMPRHMITSGISSDGVLGRIVHTITQFK
jgi:hypothetical protein